MSLLAFGSDGVAGGRRLCYPREGGRPFPESAMHRRVSFLLLVVLLLAGGWLVLAGISRVREAARRTDCTNNLRQLGLAVHGYAGDYRGFPTATVTEPSLAPERRLSWLVEILPYLEAAPRPPY